VSWIGYLNKNYKKEDVDTTNTVASRKRGRDRRTGLGGKDGQGGKGKKGAGLVGNLEKQDEGTI